jgi:spore germination cell wall hydrolase CwlJ-like protein
MINNILLALVLCIATGLFYVVDTAINATRSIVAQQTETIATLSAVVEIQQIQLTKIEARVLEIQQFVVKTNKRVAHTAADVECLARNIYWEAGIESTDGKHAVAQITINRVNDGRWGNTICKVVHAKAQFSWTLDKNKKWAVPPKNKAWYASLAVAKSALDGDRVPVLADSKHYHADYVSPKWADPNKQVTKVGTHIFYALN